MERPSNVATGYEPLQRLEGEAQPSPEHPRSHENDVHLPPRRFVQTRMLRPWPRTLWQVFILFVLALPPVIFAMILYLVARPKHPFSRRECDDQSPFDISFFIGGDLSYGQAKALDLGWNIVFGHGVQGILAAVLYSLAKLTLMRMTERTPVSYNYFVTLSFFPTSLWSIPALIRGVFSGRGWRLKLATAWLVLSCAIVIAIPPLFDAMTGYVGAQDMMLELPDKSLIMLSDKGKYETIPRWQSNQTAGYNGTVWRLPSNYVSGADHIRCSPASNQVYNWGFSSVISGATILFGIFWSFGTWCLWLDGKRNSQLDLKGRGMNTYSAIRDISAAMNRELGENIEAYSGMEIAKQLRRRPPVMYTAEEDEKGYTRIRLSSKEGPPLQMSFDDAYG